MFRVNPKTVTRWARAGKISAIRTLGGHRRFRESRSASSWSKSRKAPSSKFELHLAATTRAQARVVCCSCCLRGCVAGDRRRSGDPTLFRRVLCRLSYPAGRWAAQATHRRS